MGWLCDILESVDGVGSGTLVELTSIGDGGHVLYIWLSWNWLYNLCRCSRRGCGCGDSEDG